MKKTVSFVVLVLMISSIGFAATRKSSINGDLGPQFSIFADAGLSISDVEGLFLEGGIQYGLAENLFIEGLFDFYLSPWGSGVDGSLFGINGNLVYKMLLSDGLRLFGKGGLSFNFSSVDMGWFGSVTDSNLGLNLGGGIEYAFDEKMALRVGSTFKLMFSEGESGSWFKLYAGIQIGL